MTEKKLGVAIPSLKTLVLGVTSMTPNLGGLLIQTENRVGFQLGQCHMNSELVVDYDDGIPEIDEDWRVIDGRA